jgi:hypothetical protein
VADERGDIAGEEAFGELAHHRMLHIGLSDESAIDELAVFCSSREDAAPLEPGDDGRDGCLRELSLGV